MAKATRKQLMALAKARRKWQRMSKRQRAARMPNRKRRKRR